MGVALRRKLLWLIAVRAAAVTVLMSSAILVQTSSASPSGLNPYFVLIAITYALTAIYAATLPLVEKHRWLVDLQLACDAMIVSATVYLTGGVVSFFSSLYALPIVAATVLQFRRGGVTEFANPEELLRHDALHTPVPPSIARRWKESLGALTPPSNSWWRKFFGS